MKKKNSKASKLILRMIIINLIGSLLFIFWNQDNRDVVTGYELGVMSWVVCLGVMILLRKLFGWFK